MGLAMGEGKVYLTKEVVVSCTSKAKYIFYEKQWIC